MNETLKREIREILDGIAPEAAGADLAPGADLREQLDLDSMDVLSFATALSKRYEIEIPERDYPRLVTLEGCVAYVEEKKR